MKKKEKIYEYEITLVDNIKISFIDHETDPVKVIDEISTKKYIYIPKENIIINTDKIIMIEITELHWVLQEI